MIGGLEVRLHGDRALDEEPHRLELRQRRQSGERFWVGQPKWRNRKFLLARDAEHRAAADQHAQSRASREQLAGDRRRLDHLFEVVEDEQGALLTEVINQRVDWPAAAGRRDRKRLRNRGRHKLRIVDRAEGHEVDAVGELVKDIGCNLQAEARFAGTTRSGQREQAGLLQ